MTRKTKAAAAAIQITEDCERNADGYGALASLGISKPYSVMRPDVSQLKARLMQSGFESLEVASHGDVSLWDPRETEDVDVGPEWVLVTVLALGGDEEGDNVAVFARPAGAAAAQDVPPPAPETITKSEAHLQRKAAQFEILDPTDALLRTFTPRVEKHGEDDVSAASLGLTIEAPNTILDLLAPSLRPTLYAAPEGQARLPGVEVATPLLRTKVIETIKLTNCYEGWTLKIAAGLDEIVIGDCKVDKFVVTPRDGGSVQVDLRIRSSDIDEHEAGWLYGHLRQDIEITLHAPEVKPEPIDGSVEAFERDHPPVESPSAEDLFAASHGGDDEGGADEHETADAEA